MAYMLLVLSKRLETLSNVFDPVGLGAGNAWRPELTSSRQKRRSDRFSSFLFSDLDLFHFHRN